MVMEKFGLVCCNNGWKLNLEKKIYEELLMILMVKKNNWVMTKLYSIK